MVILNSVKQLTPHARNLTMAHNYYAKLTAVETKLAKQCARNIIEHRPSYVLSDEEIWNWIGDYDVDNDCEFSKYAYEAIFEYVRKVVNS